MTNEMHTAATEANHMALKVFSLNTVSALVSRASLPKIHSRTEPTALPEKSLMGADTAPSLSVGALDISECEEATSSADADSDSSPPDGSSFFLIWAARAAAGQVSSYTTLPETSRT